MSETSVYQKLLGPLRSPRTPRAIPSSSALSSTPSPSPTLKTMPSPSNNIVVDKDVVMMSPSQPAPSPAKPIYSNDDFIPFSRMFMPFSAIIIILFDISTLPPALLLIHF